MVTIGAAALALLGPGSGLGSAGEREAGQLGSVLKRAQQVRDIQMTDEEETKLGEAVSERIRQRYGVVQDPAIHKYVTLVGGVLAQASTRPGLQWRFIVLDTDGVNALAAPGGLVHITRGALSLIKSEAELAGVLGHEIIHVTEKHTIKAIQKGKMVQMGADETRWQRRRLQQARGQGHRRRHGRLRPRGGARGRPQGHRHRQHGGLQPQRPEGLSDDARRTQQGVDRKAGAVCLAPRDEGALRQARRRRSRPASSRPRPPSRRATRTTSPTSRSPSPRLRPSRQGSAGLAGGGSAKADDTAKAGDKGDGKTEEPEEEAGVRPRPADRAVQRRREAGRARPPARRPREASTPSATPRAAATRRWCR